MKRKQDMTPEMEKKLNACKSAEDVRRLMEAEGMELSLDDLEMVTGGRVDYDLHGGYSYTVNYDVVTVNGRKYFRTGNGELLEYVYAPVRYQNLGEDAYCHHYAYFYFLPDGTYTSCYRCHY
ncbi:hypothetical protein SAMN02910353_03014 [Ruminococcus sp. YRD2003]|uniref:Nif11-like leader peptide family natural product precursor n=1 Tax=Ruminococcus sp. YRD2003 TaxID=1452313 RepID=UPI0008D35587|nr:Nif11-like leader peptide family natural product precursor [Ruminococcus sp.]SEL61408.1 hypothetical protein SAMN02910353_03014 [Ruminococcus flavefaciens]